MGDNETNSGRLHACCVLRVVFGNCNVKDVFILCACWLRGVRCVLRGAWWPCVPSFTTTTLRQALFKTIEEWKRKHCLPLKSTNCSNFSQIITQYPFTYSTIVVLGMP